MRIFLCFFAYFSAAAVLMLPVAPAQAQGVKTYVSGFNGGDDANSCLITAPCFSLQGAHDKTADGGEINCLSNIADPFALQITKSITIDCGSSGGSFLGASLIVNGPGIVVKIRNLSINGEFGTIRDRIDFINGAQLLLENCLIHNYHGIALRFMPSAPGSQLLITNSIIENNGRPSGGGLQVIPQSGGSAGVILDHVTFGYNVTAMVLNSGSGPIGMNMKDSLVSSSRSNGILAQAGSQISFIIDRSSLTNNVGNAIQSSGANSRVFINDSSIFANDIGVSAVSGGIVQSFKNNRILGNGTDGTPLTAVPGVTGNLQ